jgi:methylenetetrahydrofolate dehydrogenase (NADP+) / methenyltetrahydrofolate cyclohydrolase
MATILDGKALAAQIKADLKGEIDQFARGGRPPTLAVVLVGEDPASSIYVKNKAKSCQDLGIRSLRFDYPATLGEAELLRKVDELNADPAVDGILVQLPLPKQIDARLVIDRIDPAKDVDGFHPQNVGRLAAGEPTFVPCTPLGVIRLLESGGVRFVGSRAVVIGRSNIVGKPVAQLLLARHCTVTVCHSRTVDLAGEARRADILVAAIGKAEMVRGDWIKEGAAVIDVGINRNAEGKLIGDVAFAEASTRAGMITPVPGGVGPMTIAMLMSNTLQAARLRGAAAAGARKGTPHG